MVLNWPISRPFWPCEVPKLLNMGSKWVGYVAQNSIPSAPHPPAPTHFWWFPPLKIALSDA